jgi:hypothetical protein
MMQKRLVIATTVALCWLSPCVVAAQNLVGSWRLDPSRSNVQTPDGTPALPNDVLTISVHGTWLELAFAENSLIGAGLPMPLCCALLPSQVRARNPRAKVGDQAIFRYDFSDPRQHTVNRVGFTVGRAGMGKYRFEARPDLSGFDVVETGAWANETHARTSADGETLTIETMTGTTHMLRVFTREH